MVTSDELVNGFGDGDTAPDWERIGPNFGSTSVDFRAERAGGGGGRVYTITVTCIDDTGNGSTTTAEVLVRHDQRKK